MMDQALRRFSRLIDLLAAAPPQGLSLHQLAEAAGLPPATCTRALKSMSALGWADQQHHRGQYRLGPRITSLSLDVPYRGRLLAVAIPALRALAEAEPRLGVSVVGLRGHQRFGLWSQGPDPAHPAVFELRPTSDVWQYPSGRLLVALLPAKQRRRHLDSLGLPDPAIWPGILGSHELNQALGEIRRAGHASLRRDGTCYYVCPVREPGHEPVAIGCWHAGAREEAAVLDRLRRCAAAIENGLPAP
jgi:DNA-binding IclR family transcriptional regulator